MESKTRSGKPTARPSQRAAKSPRAPDYSKGKWAAAFTPRSPGERRYWLVKSEPSVFSYDDLVRAPKRTTCWDGVRNFAARNFLRDGMKRGDRAFFYHSMDEPQGIAGIVEVVREGYPDDTAFVRKHPGYDPDSDRTAPTWFMVDVRAVEKLARFAALADLKREPSLAKMALLRVGRLSVTPVTPQEWEKVREIAAKP